MQRGFGYIFFFFLIKKKRQINRSSTFPVYSIRVKIKDTQKRESMCVC